MPVLQTEQAHRSIETYAIRVLCTYSYLFIKSSNTIADGRCHSFFL